MLDAASGRRSHVTVFGTDYDTPDGTCIRDYIHVMDLADAHVISPAGHRGRDLVSAYNLGIGRGFSVREVIAAVERVTGLTVPVILGERRPGDPPALVSNASKARTRYWVGNRRFRTSTRSYEPHGLGTSAHRLCRLQGEVRGECIGWLALPRLYHLVTAGTRGPPIAGSNV